MRKTNHCLNDPFINKYYLKTAYTRWTCIQQNSPLNKVPFLISFIWSMYSLDPCIHLIHVFIWSMACFDYQLNADEKNQVKNKKKDFGNLRMHNDKSFRQIIAKKQEFLCLNRLQGSFQESSDHKAHLKNDKIQNGLIWFMKLSSFKKLNVTWMSAKLWKISIRLCIKCLYYFH